MLYFGQILYDLKHGYKTKDRYHMEKDIKNGNYPLQERQAYVPVSVKMINITAQRIVCTSPNGNTEDLDEGTFNNW